jgi:ribokinase
MHDVITIGSGMVDIFMKSKQFHLQPSDAGVLLCQEYGGKLDVDDFQVQCGGAGTNTAVGFARMGFHTAAVVEMGKDIFAQVVWDTLKREKVDTQHVVTEKSERTAASVLLIAEEGGRSALTYRGASSQLEARDLPWEALRNTRWIHLSNVSGNQELLLRLFDHLRTSLVGLSWNPGKKELALLREKKLAIDEIFCDILIMNNDEWALIEEVQYHLLQKVPYIVITHGREGGRVYVKGEYELEYAIQEVRSIEETGAGDAFAVGFVSAHLHGYDIAQCCDWGRRNSANVVQHMGAQAGLLRKKDLGLHTQ